MTPRLRGIVICKGYDDILAITLPANMRHMDECLVVTSPEDERTKAVARSVPNVRLFETDAFTRPGTDGTVPDFNKGLAMEEGFSVLGRDGWILILDADILLPPQLPPVDQLPPTQLYGAKRRILEDVAQWSPYFDWSLAPLAPMQLIPGYFQLFHADDPHVRDKPYWYNATFTHCGGCDAAFSEFWPPARMVTLPIEVLHLGPIDTNWFGRASDRLDGEGTPNQAARDKMDAYLTANGWAGARRGVDRTALERVGYPIDRLEVPGHDSSYEMPGKRLRDRMRQRRR